MNIILIAMHRRHEVMKINLQLLSKQDCEIVVVVSDFIDSNFVRSLNLSNVYVTEWPNQPLGAKWQHGVDYARTFDPDMLIILGSDDFLNADYIKNASRLIKKYDFIGLTQWWIKDLSTPRGRQETIKIRYNPQYFYCPIGGGRIYSRKCLKDLNYQLFDSQLSRKLDNLGWDSLRYNHKFKVIDNTSDEGLEILSVKGTWDMINPLGPLLQAHTTEWEMNNTLNMGFDMNVFNSLK
jgi:hypothetical protein